MKISLRTECLNINQIYLSNLIPMQLEIDFKDYQDRKLDKSEIDNLVRELNELSENEKKNKERMKEIAHILTLQYLHK